MRRGFGTSRLSSRSCALTVPRFGCESGPQFRVQLGRAMAETIQGLLVWYLVFLFSTTFHEFAHAFLAYKGGDLTAYETGHVTLDPFPHIRRSQIGMVIVPLISYVQLGWMVGFR